MRLIRRLLACAALLAAPLSAEALEVAADIAPVHSLVAAVMEGAGAPALIIPQDASPHHHAMRPSEAAALARAGLVVMIGEALIPWLPEAARSLAPQARVLTLGPAAEEDAHDHAEHADDPHAHAHDGDPHLWLDPAAAAAWALRIAEALAAEDPANAALYRANAARLAQSLAALEQEIAARIAPLRGAPYAVAHDAFSHFETRFGLEKLGALADGDAARPGPARVRSLRDRLRDAGPGACVFAEPGQPDRLLRAVVQDGGARLGRLDPLGAELAAGPGLYPALLRGLAAGFEDCLAR